MAGPLRILQFIPALMEKCAPVERIARELRRGTNSTIAGEVHPKSILTAYEPGSGCHPATV
jgi:hypothetical protein